MKMLSRLCSVLFGVVALIFLVAGLWAGPPAPAPPSEVTFTVDNPLDLIDENTTDGICLPGSCSLRAAIMQANVVNGPVTIIVPSGTYLLTRPAAGTNGPENGDLNLTTPTSGNPLIKIVGAGADSTFVDAVNLFDRVLAVANGRQASISGLTIRNGFLSPPGSGGGISNEGTLTLTQVTLDHNRAQTGAGLINNTLGSLTVIRCTFTANQASFSGGGIADASGILSVVQSTFSGNTASYYGGGIYNTSHETAMVIQSTLSSNIANFDGGGICNSANCNLAVVNSTLSQNSANNNGGGIWNFGVVNIYSSSVVFNLADADHDAGGGIGGGIWNAGTFNLRHVLVAGNAATEPQAGFDDCTGTLNAYGWNLFWTVNATCTVNTQGTTWGILSSLAALGPLQNNGGPTLTHALHPSSTPTGNRNPIDSGGLAAACIDNNGIPLTTDQRGAPRPVDGSQPPDGIASCDIGAFELQAPAFGNISTRLRVETGDNALIGGFIITGTQPKKVIVRAIGPSLSSFFPGALADPVLELRNSSGALMASNDNWRSTQEADIIATGIPPSNDLESAIVATLPANNAGYTAIVRGVNNGTGIGVVEAFDLDRGAASKLGNISTRGFVNVDDNVMIAGLIVTGGNGTNLRILARALGPTLSDFGVPGALTDTTLDLVNASGTVIRSNNNWKDDPVQRALIEAAGLAPAHDEEAALVETVAPGAYTAIVRGNNRATGVGLVEVYSIP